MRPRKVIVVVSGDEFKLSRRSFLLDVAGWRVLQASTMAQAMDWGLAFDRVDALLVEMPVADVRGIIYLTPVRELCTIGLSATSRRGETQ